MMRAAIALTMIVAVGLGGVAAAKDAFDKPDFATYQPDRANGKYMFHAAGCATCHAVDGDDEILAGGMSFPTVAGTFFAPNISADEGRGIGGWSNSEFLNAVMRGISPEGDYYYPVFPFASYAGMKPEDVLDIKAHIDSLLKSGQKSKPHDLGFPFNSRRIFAAAWRNLHLDTSAFVPSGRGAHDRGKYLVEHVAHCGACHTKRGRLLGPVKAEAFQGGAGLTGEYAPSIHHTRLSSNAGSAGKTAFVDGALVKGLKLNGEPLGIASMRRVAKQTAQLTDEDREAIYLYLANAGSTVTGAAATVAPSSTLASSKKLERDADDFIGKYCRGCHGVGGKNQKQYPAGDMASIAGDKKFVTPGAPEKSLLYTSVASGQMPYGPKPSQSEIDTLKSWIIALGAPSIDISASAKVEASKTEKPEQRVEILSRDALLEVASRDLSALDAGDRLFTRYFVFTPDDRLTYRYAALNKLLNSLSNAPRLAKAEPVTGGKDQVVRIDLRDYDWTPRDWEVVAAVYPYGVSPSSEPLLGALAASTGTDIPVLRADWFAANASRPPLYNHLLKLPDTIQELEARMGVDPSSNIIRADVVRAGFGPGSSGVSDFNRLAERHALGFGGYYWKSYDFGSDDGRQSLLRHPHGPPDVQPLAHGLESFEHDGGEMIFSLKNGLQGYYLSDAAGKRLDIAPAAIVSFRQRPIGKGVEVINGRSCMDCHANGILPKRDELRDHIDRSTIFSVPQRDFLLSMYPNQEELSAVYEADIEIFTKSLDQIGAAQSVRGRLRSLEVPETGGRGELITYLADSHDDEVGVDDLAREFHLTADEFRSNAQRVQDPIAARVILDWLVRLDDGAKIHRFEIEENFAALLEPLSQLQPYKAKPAEAPIVVERPQPTADGQKAKPQPGKNTPVELLLKVDGGTSVKVGTRMRFTLETNTACALDVVYVESDGTIEQVPPQMIGTSTLQPGEVRVIPAPGSGSIIFDTPAPMESLIALCRTPGSGEPPLTAARARELAERQFLPATRGISIELSESALADNRQSGIQMVEFRVEN